MNGWLAKLWEGELLVAGVTVGSRGVTVVIGDVSGDVVTIESDSTHNLHQGARPAAYRLMRERLSQTFAAAGLSKVIFKGSAPGQRNATRGLLESAELRGVCMSAVPDGIEVKVIDKGNVSRNFGSRKFDEYTSDDDYWSKNFSGKNVRRGSRDAAFLLMVAR